MNARISRWPILSACALLVSVCGNPAHADDTEVYVGQPTSAADGRPNILFIIDTSGSMGGKVTTQIPYDPNTTYEGTCAPNRIYWKSSSANVSGLPVRDDSTCSLKDRDTSATGWVDSTKFVCKTASTIIERNGFQPVTRTAQWLPQNTASNSKWAALRRGSTTDFVECADDSDPAKMDPPHGDGTKPYAANGSNGPFTTEKAQQINWDASTNTSGTYTFYSSNYLNWYYHARTEEKTRLEIVQEVAEKTLNSISDVNVGLMRFSTDGQGGMVMHEVNDLSVSKSSLIKQIQGLYPNGNTPLSETLYESYLYWTGGTWKWGSISSPSVSVPESRQSGDTSKYKAPISASCQKNFIVYLTDGEPVSDTSSESDILKLLRTKKSDAVCTPNTGSGATNLNGRCLDDLAEYMFKTDLSPEDGFQNVVTYTVGFGADVQSVAWATDLLKETARLGGGTFYEASDTATLTSVFTSIVQEILAVNTTFTAPTVSVNAFNRTQNLNDLFITVFGTSAQYHWPGNIKKYEVDKDGTIVGQPVGGKSQPAVDPATGFFLNNAKSFWSDVVDGADVALGGAAHKLPDPANRKVFTDLAGGDLSAAGNSVATTNTAITDSMLGGLDATITRDNLIEWIRGADVNAADPADRTKPRFVMGDPLHSRPASVIYGGTQENPDMVLFAATNDGYLHAINAADGKELWSYIPSHLLNRMTDLYLNKAQPAKRYGLDGNMRVFKRDVNGNGIVDTADGDKVYLFFGMGRGGQSYFGLDVTNKTKPALMWRSGSPTEVTATGASLPVAQQLSGLGQTWSTPVVTQVKIDSAVKTVLIVGGGYDPSQDNVGYNTDDIGNRIFMLDAETGKPLWSTSDVTFATGTALQHSIPADIRVLDLDSNGLADRMYAADTGGRIWRFDIHNGSSKASLVTGGVFASLGHADGAGTDPADARRFYYAPDVSLIRNGTQTFLNLAIGSGYRGHPLNKDINDRFYSLRDYRPFTAMTQSQYNSLAPIVESNAKLVNVTNNINPTMPPDALGWRIDLQAADGEKVLAEARTFENKILFTSYLPNSGSTVPSTTNSCVARQGANRLYTVSALDGRPVFNRDGSTNPDGTTDNPDSTSDRWAELSQSGIAPEPVILFPETPAPTCIVGVEQCGVAFTNNPVRTFWNRQDTDSGN